MNATVRQTERPYYQQMFGEVSAPTVPALNHNVSKIVIKKTTNDNWRAHDAATGSVLPLVAGESDLMSAYRKVHVLYPDALVTHVEK